ncbi:MAG TPA: hypothetical protein DET40_00625 [Lentisphaeria bacterium]|nr:MAG: hypothetical protein A2X45_09460 [Lentisphaerae bacterium GWF2_50_93]HCE42037.1 hypothetical protein [Lentisphaeria bacterium]
MKIDIGRCFSYGFEKVMGNPLFYIGGFFLVAGLGVAIKLISQGFGFIFNIIIQSVFDISKKSALMPEYIATVIVGVVLGFFLAPFLVGYFRGIKKEYAGLKAEPLDVLLGFDVLTPSVANYAAANIIFIAGLMCCFIPGIIVAPLLYLTIFFLAKGETIGFSALMKAIDTLKKNPILIVWNLVFMLFAGLGILLCVVGVLVTGPISICASYMLFQQVTGEGEPQKSPVVMLEDETPEDKDDDEENNN